MPSGRKPQPKAEPRAPLTDSVPRDLRGRARDIYRALARELITEGYACRCDWRAVALAAKTEAHAERLEAELEGSVMSGGRLHPAVKELRAVRGQLVTIYSQLLITPRGRVASRMTESQARSAGAKQDKLEEFLSGN